MLMYNIALVTNGSPVSYCGVSTSPLIFPSEISPDFAPPIDTWADMSHLLRAEHWPLGEPPESLQYLCGVLPAAPTGPPVSDPSVPAAAHRRAGVDLARWLDEHAVTAAHILKSSPRRSSTATEEVASTRCSRCVQTATPSPPKRT